MPSCGSPDLDPLLDLGDMPLANSVLTTAALDRPDPRHPLAVLFCPACALVQIGATVAPEEMFSDYAYFSSYSTTAVERAGALVASLVESRGLGAGSLAVEVASNDGYLLRHYVARGCRCWASTPQPTWWRRPRRQAPDRVSSSPSPTR